MSITAPIAVRPFVLPTPVLAEYEVTGIHLPTRLERTLKTTAATEGEAKAKAKAYDIFATKVRRLGYVNLDAVAFRPARHSGAVNGATIKSPTGRTALATVCITLMVLCSGARLVLRLTAEKKQAYQVTPADADMFTRLSQPTKPAWIQEDQEKFQNAIQNILSKSQTAPSGDPQ